MRDHWADCICDACVRIRAGNVTSNNLIERGETRYAPGVEEAMAAQFAIHFPWSSQMEGSDADHPVAADSETVAGHVADILSDLQFGKCTRGQAGEVKRAAERAIADHDVARSIGKL